MALVERFGKSIPDNRSVSHDSGYAANLEGTLSSYAPNEHEHEHEHEPSDKVEMQLPPEQNISPVVPHIWQRLPHWM